ncbi:TPA: restriction endonuclease subunit S [Clostridioides difficile]|jgi:type I restriction enzyme S subunit|nr:restriction endonuclease subunit S [Clostridioides difficile]HBG8755701.1 restriction endonuclease subunit S [Clostridioides difficile]HBG9111770.1 restriction endonuclease subunit S [Clostridioides difficile]
MKSNYKQLGQFIRQVDVRNSEGKEENLLGVSVQKKFIPSIANTVGTDFKKYKVVKKGQFTYIPDTSRRGDKIGIALLEDYEEGLVSNVYTVFEIIDEKQLIPEYLMLWFSRPEFDRYARFKSHGSVREVMDWDEMCKVELPVPPYEKQKEIVDGYKAITERIALKQKINDNLVAVGTASIQKNVGRGALINLTEAEMDRLTLPDGFEIQTVSEFCRETKSGSTPSRTNNEYWENGTISWVKSGEVHNNITLQTEEYITPLGLNESSTKLLPKDTVLMAMYGVTAGEIGYLAIEATTNQAICGMICNSKANAAYLYFSLIQSQTAISRLSNGGAQDNLSKNFIDNIKIVVPPSEFIEKMKLAAIVEQMTLNTKEIAILEELQATALAQLSSC